MTQTVLVTGGAGFIGSALIRFLMTNTKHRVVNIDKLTYAGDLESISEYKNDDRYVFINKDICDAQAIQEVFASYQPTFVMHLAAESHVDRSITGSAVFIQTNIVGTYTLLEESRRYLEKLPADKKNAFRFLHISTDEVYGHLGMSGFFTEDSVYKPSSPYSASKASSDHLVRAWHHTFGIPVLITNCSNNYGPWQFPEKLIPVVINSAVHGKNIPIYGQGANVRDWLYVDDHVNALWTVINKGRIGETYVVGGHGERTNLEVCNTICNILDELKPSSYTGGYKSLIKFVTDRPGHDFRYAIDPTKITKELQWKPRETFETGLKNTVQWYLNNQPWCDRLIKK